MTEQEIIEGNKSIAIFLEYKEGFPHYVDEYGYNQCAEGFDIPDKNHESHFDDKDDHQFSLIQLEFHSSWNWLMPVVEKIESLGFDTRIQGITEDTFYQICEITDIVNNEITYQKTNSKILSVWLTVIEFIEWCNKQ